MDYLVSGGEHSGSSMRVIPFAQQLGGMLADSHLELYVFDAETLRFIQVSEGARRNLGYTRDELRDMTPLDIKPEFDRSSFEAALKPLRDASEPLVQFETCHRRKNGSEYPVWVRMQLFGDAVFLALLEDITVRRTAEQALLRQGEALAEADERKNAFLATLGHELRSPVAAIRNALESQRRRRRPDPETEAAFELIERQVTQISGVVDGLLDLSLISRGKIRLELEPIRLVKLAESAAEAVRPAIAHRRQQLYTDFRSPELCLQGDGTRLVQVFTNLLSNASKYTPEGHRIWLTVRRDGKDAIVEVQDEGRGIREDDLVHIFEPFTRREGASSHDGLGLGLPLAKALVALHGGRIHASSPGPGRGTRMTVRLPAAESPSRDGHH